MIAAFHKNTAPPSMARWLTQIARRALLLFLFSTEAVLARNLFLEWREVQGAGGYKVEIENSAGEVVLERETQETKINFVLPPGDYRHRIGVLNKFRKISVWSEWSHLIIKIPEAPEVAAVLPPQVARGKIQNIELRGENLNDSTEVRLIGDTFNLPGKVHSSGSGRIRVRFDLSHVESGRYRLRVQNKELEARPQFLTVTEGEAGNWQALVPGLSQYKTGAYGRSALWATAFLGMTAASSYESYQASLIANQARKDTGSRIFFNPGVLLLAKDSLGQNQDDLTTLGILYTQTFLAQRRAYNQHINNHILLGAGAGLLYVLQYGDATGWSLTELVPGYAQFKRGNPVRGALFTAAFVGLAGAAIVETQAAAELAKERSSDPFLSMLDNPAYTYALLNNNSGTMQRQMLTLAYAVSTQKAAAYRVHQQNQLYIAGAASTAYLLHLFDNSLSYAAGLQMRNQEGEPINELALTLFF